MAESLSVNDLTWQIAQEEILNDQRRESFKSYIIVDDVTVFLNIFDLLLQKLHISGKCCPYFSGYCQFLISQNASFINNGLQVTYLMTA